MFNLNDMSAMHIFVRSVCMVFLITAFPYKALTQDISYASRVIEYHPAPGQFVNDPYSGIPAVASGLTGKTGNPLSLGGYGGYIIFGFEEPVINKPENLFGIDFIIVGNALDSHAEQGIVKVMKDTNKNGLPDDVWYEIKGSDHFLEGFRRSYQITYYNPMENTDVQWKDIFFNSGFIRKNQYHTQPYYPSAEYFPELNPDSLTFSGSLHPGKIKEINGQIVSGRSYFGYADNTTFFGVSDPLIPDNPNTRNIEGCGGDGIDISWAVDEEDNYVNLEEIDFVMIHSGVNRNAGWLGEISTEVGGIIVVSPLPGISGATKMIMPLNLPGSLPAGSQINIESVIFDKGKPVWDKEIVWESANPDVVSFNNNLLTCHIPGIATLTAILDSDNSISFDTELRVFNPVRLKLSDKTIAIRAGENRTIGFRVFDDTDQIIEGSGIHSHIGNTEILKMRHISGSGELVIEGLREGSSFIDISPSGYENLAERLNVHVYNPVPEISCFLAVRNNEQVLLSRREIFTSNIDFSERIDRKPDDYIFPSGFVSLASVISKGLNSGGYNISGNDFRFRIDDKSDGELYLWQLIKDWEYTYGWGGSSGGGIYSRCWAATVNGNVFINGFDKIPVSNDDVVSLNYVENINTGFSEVVLKEDMEYEASELNRRFLALQYHYQNDGKGGFIPSHIPLNGEKILVLRSDGSEFARLYTGSDGSFSVEFESSGIYRIFPENYPGEELVINTGTTGRRPEKDQGDILIFPNPFTDVLYIRMKDPGSYSFLITDVSGRTIVQKRIINKNLKVIEMSDLTPGIYILSICYQNTTSNYRIIKE